MKSEKTKIKKVLSAFKASFENLNKTFLIRKHSITQVFCFVTSGKQIFISLITTVLEK